MFSSTAYTLLTTTQILMMDDVFVYKKPKKMENEATEHYCMVSTHE